MAKACDRRSQKIGDQIGDPNLMIADLIAL